MGAVAVRALIDEPRAAGAHAPHSLPHIQDDGLTGDWLGGDRVDGRALRDTAGAFPSGVTVITATGPDGSKVGMTVSSFTSVSLEPPLILVCVAKSARSLPAFRVGTPMGVNVLGSDQASVAMRFASRSEDRFAGVPHGAGPNGVPLLDGVAAWLSTHIHRIYDGGDHLILLARVNEVHRSGLRPLLYHSGRMHEWALAAASGAGAR